MVATLTLPSVETIPDDIDEQLRHLIHYAPDQVNAAWLSNLIKNSTHLTTPDYMRWRVVSLVWLATEFDLEEAWPYLMWLNMNEPEMGEHFNDILTDGVEELQCHVQMATWIAGAEDERLKTFFSTYKNIPAPHKMGPLLRRLVNRADDPAVGRWLTGLCADTADNPSPLMRPWRLLIAAWVATRFDPTEGLTSLRQLSEGQATLSAEDNKLLMDKAAEIKAGPAMIQWIADCPDPAVKTMLQQFGHPDLDAFVADIFDKPPAYDHLIPHIHRAERDAHTFEQLRDLLEALDVSKSAAILDLACGPLAPQTLLLNSAGYNVTGADLHIPPAYLPAPSFLQRLFKKGKYVKAWEETTQAYYEALGRHIGTLNLTWRPATIELADVTRLQFADDRFEVVICADYLHHAPDVNGLLAEAVRVLKPGGLFLANIKPYSSLGGGFQDNEAEPWGHLRDEGEADHDFIFNRWRETQFHDSLAHHFTIEQWRVEQDETAEARITPVIQAELAHYSPEELTRQHIVVVARQE